MGQVTIYIDAEIEKKMIASAKAENISKSKWVTELIKEKVAPEWPASVVNLAEFNRVEGLATEDWY